MKAHGHSQQEIPDKKIFELFPSCECGKPGCSPMKAPQLGGFREPFLCRGNGQSGATLQPCVPCAGCSQLLQITDTFFISLFLPLSLSLFQAGASGELAVH